MKGFLDEGTKDVTSSLKPSHNCGVWCEIKDDRCFVDGDDTGYSGQLISP